MSLEWLQELELAKQQHGHKHHHPMSDFFVTLYIIISACLVLMAGLMSGLTLGLLTLDRVDMEVLKRSGSAREQQYAARIMPVIKHQHFLLVTLLLCNAACTEALPLFLDRLVDPITAVLLSVTVVLVFGEVLPQAVCSRYGLQVGANSVWFVRALMFVCAPLAWPIGKLLDLALGGEHTALFRRRQLKALVALHSVASGGTLSSDEVSIIQGALDLTSKTAWRAMTSLDKVFMLPMEQVLDERTLQIVLTSGHSRVPVYADGDRRSIMGIILVKELILVDPEDGLTVANLNIRALPTLSADTPLYDILKLFELGRRHMALLTKPAGAEVEARPGMPSSRSGMLFTRDNAYYIEKLHGAHGGEDSEVDEPGHDWHDAREGEPVGIITIEDVIEELLGQEIIDESDLYVDNEQTTRVNAAQLDRALPQYLRRVVADNRITPRVGRLGHKHMQHIQHMQHLAQQAALPSAMRAKADGPQQQQQQQEGQPVPREAGLIVVVHGGGSSSGDGSDGGSASGASDAVAVVPGNPNNNAAEPGAGSAAGSSNGVTPGSNGTAGRDSGAGSGLGPCSPVRPGTPEDATQRRNAQNAQGSNGQGCERSSSGGISQAIKPALVRSGSRSGRSSGRRVSFDERLEQPHRHHQAQNSADDATAAAAVHLPGNGNMATSTRQRDDM